jgi:2-dehydro-3-deoxy-D-arabinonate dehydratase
LIQTEPLAPTTRIHLQIERAGIQAFEGETTLAQLKRTPAELAGFLYRDNTFPQGAFLMTGTGIVPGDEFTLHSGDVVKITIEGIGTLANPMA